MKAPANTSKILRAEAKNLIDRIFRCRPCVVHYKNTGRNTYRDIEKHHLIHKSQSIRFKFNIRNIIPVRAGNHRIGKEAAHEDRDKFLAWVEKNLPLHWSWYLEHKDEAPRTLYTADWAEICFDLRYYANHPYKAEQIIYEK